MILAKLKSVLRYDPVSGIWRWIVSPRYDIRVGDIAGTLCNGYRRIKIRGTLHSAARLAWLYMTGEWPIKDLDHINGDCADDRFCNLRLASHGENMRNKGKYTNNKSGFKGVSWHHKKWRATIQLNRKAIYIGSFDTVEEAYAAYCAMGRKLHGRFFRG